MKLIKEMKKKHEKLNSFYGKSISPYEKYKWKTTTTMTTKSLTRSPEQFLVLHRSLCFHLFENFFSKIICILHALFSYNASYIPQIIHASFKRLAVEFNSFFIFRFSSHVSLFLRTQIIIYKRIKICILKSVERKLKLHIERR